MQRGIEVKVAIFCDYLHSFGGTEHYNATLALELKERDIDVRVFVCEKPTNLYWFERLQKHNIKTYAPKHFRKNRDDRSIDDEFIKDIMADFTAWSPDIIHASPAGNLLSAYLRHKKAPKIPVVATEHTTPCTDSAFWYPKHFGRILNCINTFVATCTASAKGIKNFHKFDGPIQIIPHFIRKPRLHKTKHIPNSVACIARMSPEKGIGVLLFAWKEVIRHIPGAKLFLYGDGRAKPHYERLAMSLGLGNNVVFAGVFDPSLGSGTIANKHDIFVQPSLFESIPTSLIELALLGKPVIATKVGGIKELINNKTGVLIKSCSTDLLARAIIKLLQDEERQKILGQQLKKSVCNKYDIQHNIDSIIKLYQNIIKTTHE